MNTTAIAGVPAHFLRNAKDDVAGLVSGFDGLMSSHVAATRWSDAFGLAGGSFALGQRTGNIGEFVREVARHGDDATPLQRAIADELGGAAGQLRAAADEARAAYHEIHWSSDRLYNGTKRVADNRGAVARMDAEGGPKLLAMRPHIDAMAHAVGIAPTSGRLAEQVRGAMARTGAVVV